MTPDCTESNSLTPWLAARGNCYQLWINWDNNAYQVMNFIKVAEFILEIVFKIGYEIWNLQLCLFSYFVQLSSRKHRCEFLFLLFFFSTFSYRADYKGFWKVGCLNKIFQVHCNPFEYKINCFPAVRHYIEYNWILIAYCLACLWMFTSTRFFLLQVHT